MLRFSPLLLLGVAVQVLLIPGLSEASPQATDPDICLYINEEYCFDPMVKSLCPLKCLPSVPDPSFCQFIGIKGCLEESVKKVCPRKCDKLDHELCVLLEPGGCSESIVKALCPNMCNPPLLNTQICQYISKDGCVDPSVKSLCPRKCASPDPPICHFINKTGCVEETVNALCPIKCDIPACPPEEGYYYQDSTKQCFRWYGSTKMNWTEASEFCEKQSIKPVIVKGFKGIIEPIDKPEGKMSLAYPYEPAELRDALVKIYGGGGFQADSWVNAKYDGSNFLWQDTNEYILALDSPLWWPGPNPPARPINDLGEECVILLAGQKWLEPNSDSPYFNTYCDNLYYPLCELHIE